jgi:hypothetical protein
VQLGAGWESGSLGPSESIQLQFDGHWYAGRQATWSARRTWSGYGFESGWPAVGSDFMQLARAALSDLKYSGLQPGEARFPFRKVFSGIRIMIRSGIATPRSILEIMVVGLFWRQS